MVYVITEPCIGMQNAACMAICPVDCIYEGPDQHYINADECIGCGECVAECPVSAIYATNSVPANWQSYIEKNRAFFGS
jgi:Fe-S-cluster-containing hydrogenase component 2